MSLNETSEDAAVKLLYKYFLMTAVPLVLCLIVIGTGLSFQMYNYSVSEKHDTLERAASRISQLTYELFQNPTLSREQMLKTILTTMTDDGLIHVIICDADGQIIMTSDRFGSQFIGAFVNKDTLEKTDNSDEFTSIGTLDGLYSGKNYTVGLPSTSPSGNTVAYVYVTTSVENVQTLMSYVIDIFVLFSIIVFVITAGASYFLVRRMTRPLNLIAQASRSFAMGDFKKRVPVQTDDEIGALTTAFNNMADSLEKSEELRRSFVANVSHELRSPMTSISGFVDGILDGTIPKEREDHYLRIVSDEVHRLSRLVSRMLDITVLQGSDITAESSEFDFCELIHRAATSLEKRIEDNNLTLNIELSARNITIFANEDSIFQVIYNLLDNAIKFSTQGTEIKMSAIERGDRINFSVSNFGAEITKDQLMYVFDRFHKADNSRSKDKSGLGLGLYIAKTIISRHRGDISAQSENGYTTFSFTMPTRQPEN